MTAELTEPARPTVTARAGRLARAVPVRIPLPHWSSWTALAPTVDAAGPRIRLGLVWAAIALLACATGPITTAVVFAAVAFAAAGQSCRAWRRATSRAPYPPVAIGGATLVALAGGAGPVAVGAAAFLVAVAAVVTAHTRLGGRAWDGRLTAQVALLVGVGASALPVVRAELDTTAALVLLATVLVAEASDYLIGIGGRTSFDGPVAGAAAVAAVSLAVAAVFVPPFRGASPWILGAIVAVLVPLGPRAASTLLPRPNAFAPALRRIDGFLIAGPVWAVVAAFLLEIR